MREPAESPELLDYAQRILQANVREMVEKTRDQKTTGSSYWSFTTRVGARDPSAAASPSPETGRNAEQQTPPEDLMLPWAFFKTPVERKPTKLIALNEWEGVVASIDQTNGTFVAHLEDQSSKSPVEVAEFPLDDVRSDDLPLLREGAVFRWVVGKRENMFGGVERTSTVTFRRLPAYSVADLKRAKDWASDIAGSLKVE